MSWEEIKKALNSTLGNSDFKSLDQLFGDDISSLQTALASLLQGGNVPVVKSVQMGIVEGGKSRYTDDINGNITINSVNTAKSLILVNGTGKVNTGEYQDELYGTFGASVSFTNSSTIAYQREYAISHSITGSTTYYNYPTFSWQVIEFY